MSGKLDIREAPADLWPLCPHCKEELRYIWAKSKGMGFLQKKQFLICPHCRSFLSYGTFNYN